MGSPTRNASLSKRGVSLFGLAIACSCSREPARSERSEIGSAQREPAAPHFSLRVNIVDEPVQTWTPETLAKVPHHASKNRSGQDRATWSLRELAHVLVGPDARVIQLVGGNGSRAITAAEWADPARTPIVHITGRGALKFRWAAADGTWLEDDTIRDVTDLQLQRQ